jgi:hypothetical protein
VTVGNFRVKLLHDCAKVHLFIIVNVESCDKRFVLVHFVEANALDCSNKLCGINGVVESFDHVCSLRINRCAVLFLHRLRKTVMGPSLP